MGERLDLSGKVAIVTGANTGIGLEIARGLAMHRARVVLACRSRERGQAALEELSADTCSDRLELELVDTSLTRSIREFAARVRARHARLDVLVNNAGVWRERREETAEGVELTFATNVLGYFTVTRELLPLLEATPHARIVNVASKMARRPRLDDLEHATRAYSGVDAYSESKGANRLLTWELDRRLDGKRVYANAVHPGMVASEITRADPQTGLLRRMSGPFFRVFGRSTRDGADTALWAATSADCEMSRGNFLERRKIARCKLRDERLERELWEACEARVAAIVAAT